MNKKPECPVKDTECRKCIYKKQCQGKREAGTACLFAKTKKSDKTENWLQYQ